MSVLIKGMEMPTSCWECHFGHGDTGICVVDFKSHGDWNEPQDCPLVPVPPHGRLIDADAMKDTDSFVHKTMLFGGQVVYSQEAIDNAPTIIPASEEGE